MNWFKMILYILILILLLYNYYCCVRYFNDRDREPINSEFYPTIITPINYVN